MITLPANGRVKEDCAVIATSNYLGLSYDEVLSKFDAIARTLGVKLPSAGKGTASIVSDTFYLQHGLKKLSVPRRGQSNLTGIVEMHSAGANWGHMVVLLDGIVFDAFVPNGLSLTEYRARYTSRHIRKVWK
jgi:hypothetical protein